MQETRQIQSVRLADQAQACEAVARSAQTVLQALRKAGVPEAQANMILAGVAAAGVTLRGLESGKPD